MSNSNNWPINLLKEFCTKDWILITHDINGKLLFYLSLPQLFKKTQKFLLKRKPQQTQKIQSFWKH